MKKSFKFLIGVISLIAVLAYVYLIYPLWGFPFNSQRHGQLPLTPSWALECWLWEDDVNTAAYVDELLEGYEAHDIPVKTILIDSPWSNRYNDFEIDTLRYPNPSEWFKKLEDKGYRVVLWMTPNINRQNKDTRIKDSKEWSSLAIENNYVVSNDDSIKWWKGEGGFIDYTNNDARTWWHGLQETVFDLGIDGWKLDGSATLFRSEFLGIPFLYKKTSDGMITTREYMDLYYRSEYQYGLTKNPEFVTLSRAIDRKYIHPEGFSPFDASPVNWVGDQRHTWKSSSEQNSSDDDHDLVMDGVEGIEMAIEHILASATVGYNIVGSDVAGFSGREIPPRLYIRWAQFSAFCGLFLNGGHGERRLWKRSELELNVIRKFSWLHTELIPYIYHYVVTAHNNGRRLISPLDEGTYQYFFGDYFMISPIFEDSSIKEVYLPEGNWRYFFNDLDLIEGNQKIQREFPIDEFPAFILDGAIVPMNISRNYTKIGDRNSEGFSTILIYPDIYNTFRYYHPDSEKWTDIHYDNNDNRLNIELNGDYLPHILNIHSSQKPQRISLDNQMLKEDFDWSYEESRDKIIIKTKEYEKGSYNIKF